MAGDADGGIFAGKKFWVAQRVPTRSTFCNAIRNHGGTTVILEQNADYLIADHARPNAAPVGSISWKWIEASISQGGLADIEAHRAGPAPGYIRPAGSQRPAKSSRERFTDADDLILWRWVKDAERDGAAIKGNVIYDQLEAKNDRHTSQSWRDRWVKYVSQRPPPPGANEPPPPLPAVDTSAQHPPSTAPQAQAVSLDRNDNQANKSPPPPASTAPAQTAPRPVFRMPKLAPLLSQPSVITVRAEEKEDEESNEDIAPESDSSETQPRQVHSGRTADETVARRQSEEEANVERIAQGGEEEPGPASGESSEVESVHEVNAFQEQATFGRSTDMPTSQRAHDTSRSRSVELQLTPRQTQRETEHVNHNSRPSPGPSDDSFERDNPSPVIHILSPSAHQEPLRTPSPPSSFNEEERKFLWFEANNLMCAMAENPDEYHHAWQAVAEKFPNHTADAWQDCWEHEVLPDIKRNRNIRTAVTGLEYARLPASRRASARFLADVTPDRTAAVRARHSAGAVLEATASQSMSASPRKRVRFGGDQDPSDTQQSIEFDTLPNGNLIVKQEPQEPEDGPFRSAMKRSAPLDEHGRSLDTASHELQSPKRRRIQAVNLISDDEDSQENVDTAKVNNQDGEFSIYQDDGLVEDDKENRPFLADLPHSENHDTSTESNIAGIEPALTDILAEQGTHDEFDEGTEESHQDEFTTESQPSQHVPPRSNRIIAESTVGSSPLEHRSETPSSDVFLDAAQTQSDLESENAEAAPPFETARDNSIRPRWQDTQAFLDNDSLVPDFDLPLPEPDEESQQITSIEDDADGLAEEPRHITQNDSQTLFVSEYGEDSLPHLESDDAHDIPSSRKTATRQDSSPPIPDDIDEEVSEDDTSLLPVIYPVDDQDDEQDFSDDELYAIPPARRGTQIETQAFLDADMQDVDLSLPLPAPSVADSNDLDTRDSIQHANGDTLAEAASQSSSSLSDDPVLARWFEGQRLADTEDNILRAFDATNGDMKLAAQLLVLWRRGRPTPRDVPGVFHAEHDEMLLGTDARAVRRVYTLHGREAADERLRRLEERFASDPDD